MPSVATARRAPAPHGPDGGERIFSRRLAASHVLSIAILIGVVVTSIFWVSAKHNALAQESYERMVRGGLVSLEAKMATVVRDYSIWEEAYQAIRAADYPWIYSSIGIAAASEDIGTVDLVVITDPLRNADYGWVRGSGERGEAGVLPPPLLATLLALLDGTDPAAAEARTTYARFDGGVWVFAVTRVLPPGGLPEGVTDAEAPRQIHGVRLAGDVLAGLGSHLISSDLLLLEAPEADLGLVALENAAGVVIGHVAWERPRPGDRILRQMAAPLGAALLIAAIIAAVSSRFAVSAASRLERALADARLADRSKTEFLSNVSHELRTPMNGILGVAQLLEMSALDAEQRHLLQVLTASANTQMSLISDLLDLTQIETGNRRLEAAPFEPAAVIREVADLIRPAATGKGLTLEVDVDAAAARPVLGDRRAFKQIITNLAGNAVKFTDTGMIGISAATRIDDATAHLELRVSDTGRGIDPADQARIFERFAQVDGSQTREISGTGLGLAISKSLAEMMGGGIAVDSAPGAGSTFRVAVSLPSCAQGVAAAPRDRVSA
ncbi:MAG: hypothetical protein COY86_03665 [Rhodobacterales bacterium CG_4_10_14_0_8_um_filter_70_9]|nr:MAG: hypothetical protein COY86_03665 [Rhodobacterales bacterium CG_4_10_14_0_8_um_filter_70_9]